ncbi:hypothetical protein JL100_031060 (plasmid) [Skermanella mucosa]|uniref:hypothetical protein n=1 Tax=Skermanella mucosa TaxID=1789672 RepID=UPI00192C5DCC|nr:hypothetical protein [Skermanella mucosa]UEM24648.1 hypothetical protein JL100_031060 [Skermanella mucosa]
MTDRSARSDIPEDDGAGTAHRARKLAERGLHEQALGHEEEAYDLLSQAQAIDPAAVDAVLTEHDAGRAPDARDQATSNRDVDHIPPRRPG